VEHINLLRSIFSDFLRDQHIARRNPVSYSIQGVERQKIHSSITSHFSKPNILRAPE